MPQDHAGKRAIDHHLPEVVWISTSREEPVHDETAPGAKNKILLQKVSADNSDNKLLDIYLDISRMMKPIADNEAGERDAKVVGQRLKLGSSWLI